MSEYTPYSVFLSDNQKSKLKSCINKGESCSLTIQPKAGNTKLHLTKTQIDALNNAKKHNKGAVIELSKTQLSKTGRFILPLLAAAAPLIARAALSGAVSYGAQKALQKVTRSGNGAILPQRKSGSGIKPLKKTKKVK